MKTRILIVMAAMFAMIMAVGCSDDQRVANTGSLSDLAVPESNITTPGSDLEIAGNHNNPGVVALMGHYYEYDGVCPFLFVDNVQVVELRFPMLPPDFVEVGAELEVSGHYAINQYSKCEIGPMFNVETVKLHRSGQDGPPNDRLGPKEEDIIGIGSFEGPRPVVVLGTFHRIGASCMYIEINKEKIVELNLQTNSPFNPEDGAIVQATGHYSMLPVTPCNLGQLFIATDMVELTDSYEPPTDGGFVAGRFGPQPQILLGTFRRLGASCKYLEIDKIKSVELSFPVSSPQGPTDGDIIEVAGFYSTLPGSECALGQVFVVSTYTILSDRYTPPGDVNLLLGGENPRPQIILGRYYRMGATCEYIQSDKEKNIELQFQTDSPGEIKEGSLLLVTGQYSMLPSLQCGFDQTFIVESFSELSDHADQSEDIPAPAGSNPDNHEPVLLTGPVFYYGDGCLFVQVSKNHLVELQFLFDPPDFEIGFGSIVIAYGHFLSNPTSNCNLGPVFGANRAKFYRTDGLPNPGDGPASEEGPIVLIQGTLGHWGGENGCPYLEVGKDTFVELSFLQDAPIGYKDGTFLEVSGIYTVFQSSDCQIGPMLIVASMTDAPIDKMPDSGMQDQNN